MPKRPAAVVTSQPNRMRKLLVTEDGSSPRSFQRFAPQRVPIVGSASADGNPPLCKGCFFRRATYSSIFCPPHLSRDNAAVPFIAHPLHPAEPCPASAAPPGV